MANLTLTLSCGSLTNKVNNKKRFSMPGIYECKTCQRQFPSFQALGGHRTSHKRPRARAEGIGLVLGASKKAKQRHECTVCGAEFAMGQALGGHMRRHKSMVDPDDDILD
ncbi:hypothetical protein LUZ61_013162 [Rhynchospora tenuis]|uniref:C2H2-type domain-containing protein n=1 Tax=Rhynchospora tenuis TaxID=198213 RepID=A0AAD5WA11_9POAL|nr:hypothetical protein LUZ61_013162 [Rhynchospora tenuis]